MGKCFLHSVRSGFQILGNTFVFFSVGAVHPPMHHGHTHRPHATRAIHQTRTRGSPQGLSSAQSSAARFTVLCTCVVWLPASLVGHHGNWAWNLVQTCDTAHLGQQCGRTPCLNSDLTFGICQAGMERTVQENPSKERLGPFNFQLAQLDDQSIKSTNI